MPLAPRSMLFVSGEQPARFAKAMASGADVVCIDLEDAVAPAVKQRAREAALDFARVARDPAERVGPGLALRINGLQTREGLEDVLALARASVTLDYLVIPKVEHSQYLAMLHDWLPSACGELIALVESPLGIEHAHRIAAAASTDAPRLQALALGGVDLSQALGSRLDWNGLLFARGRLVNAARAAGLQAWDVPYLDVRDPDGLREETRAVSGLGFVCKMAIHPAQVPVIHAAMAPSEDEVQWATGLLAALAERAARAADVGAFLYEGRMVDAPVIQRARRIIGLSAG